MTEHFTLKVKFDIDFDIKPVMTDDEKVGEHKPVGSLMAEQKMILRLIIFQRFRLNNIILLKGNRNGTFKRTKRLLFEIIIK